jgi:hypothetical protein
MRKWKVYFNLENVYIVLEMHGNYPTEVEDAAKIYAARAGLRYVYQEEIV